jgi:hypothetical protein
MLYEADLIPWRKSCNEYKSCDICTLDKACGWCANSQQCLPGNQTNAYENKCSSGWLFESCENKIAFIIFMISISGLICLLLISISIIILYRKKKQLLLTKKQLPLDIEKEKLLSNT